MNKTILLNSLKNIRVNSNVDCFNRLEQIMHDNKRGDSDVVCALAHVLKYKVYNKLTCASLYLHKDFMNEKISNLFKSAGISCLLEGDKYRIALNRTNWIPSWLTENKDPCYEAFKEDTHKLDNNHFPLENYLKQRLNAKYQNYRNLGQRDAVRLFLGSSPDSTFLISLPTGAGKSLLATTASLVDVGLTVVVVPTVSLATDLARKYKEDIKSNISHELIWVGDQSQELRKSIKQRISNNKQQILFTSPESFVGSLARTIYDIADKGWLKNIIIDEAHIVSMWGDDFRPDYQMLAAMWKNLKLETSKNGYSFRTLLMSATITDESYTTLSRLFNHRLQTYSWLYLRTEPSYWTVKAQSYEDKQEYILEALINSPRPAILYFTKKDDVRQWSEILVMKGFNRFATVTGETSSINRQNVINNWMNDDIDIVVSTSAFGLGMDKKNIRTIIHGCVPETVDRYYQDCGRGGRDSKVSVSIMIFTEEDIQTAKKLSIPSYVGAEKGLKRWKSMKYGKKTIEMRNINNYLLFHLDSKHEDVKQDSEANRKWNMRTLLLLEKTGYIKIHWERPKKNDINKYEEAELEEIYLDNYQSYMNTVPIIITPNRPSLDLQETWNQIRYGNKGPASKHLSNWSLMESLVMPKKHYCMIFSKLYTVSDFAYIPPMPCRNQCPVCRSSNLINNTNNQQNNHDIFPRQKVDYYDVTTNVSNEQIKCLYEHRNKEGISYLFYESMIDDRKLIDFIKYFFSLGVFELRVPDQWFKDKRLKRELKIIGQNRFICIEPISTSDNNLYNFPVITILDKNTEFLQYFANQSRWNIVLCSELIMQDEHRRLNTIVKNFRIANFFKEN